MEGIKRKEVHLYPIVIGRLQILADKKKWSLKQFMESVLEKESRRAINDLPSLQVNKGKK